VLTCLLRCGQQAPLAGTIWSLFQCHYQAIYRTARGNQFMGKWPVLS
jgi:hypothetical protein